MKNKKKVYISLSILFILIISSIGLGVRHYYKLRNPQDLFTPKDKKGAKEDEDQVDISEEFDRNVLNILLVGFDKDEGRSETENIFRTDTNILASINLEEKTVDMISIPRDSYVAIAHMDGKRDKFNSSFVHGYLYGGGTTAKEKTEKGYEYLLDTTKDLLGGIPINYYVAVDMDVVQEIVDAIGGVEIEIPQDVISRSKKVAIEKGTHVLNGKDLMYYARNRQLRDGDIDRVKNQQRIVMAIFKTLKESNKFSALPKIYKSMMDNIETNMNLNQMTALALFGMDLDMKDLETHMLKGEFGHFNNLAYWIINQEARVELIEDIFGFSVEAALQDPTEETATSLNINITRTRYNIGEQGRISGSGSTNLVGNKSFRPGDIIFYSSNRGVITVDGNGIIRAVGPGQATVTASIDGLSRSVNLEVNQPVSKPEKPKEDPVEKPGGPKEDPEEKPVEEPEKPGKPEEAEEEPKNPEGGDKDGQNEGQKGDSGKTDGSGEGKKDGE